MVPSGDLTWPWKITIFNGENPLKIAIFNSYVSLPEGKFELLRLQLLPRCVWKTLMSATQTCPATTGGVQFLALVDLCWACLKMGLYHVIPCYTQKSAI